MRLTAATSRLGFALLWLFVFSMPMEKSILIPGLGTISRVAGLFAMAGGLVAIASQGRIRLPGSIHIALGVFVFWCALTARWSISQEYTEDRITTYVQLLCLLWLVWELCVEERQVLSLLEAYVFGSLIPVVQTVHQYLSGKQSSYNRYAMDGIDPNDLALTLAISLPMSYYLSLRFKGIRAWICRIQLIATMAVIVLTASRGGTIAMVIGLSLVLWTLPSISRRARRAILSAFVLALVAAVTLVPAASWTRIATLGSEITEGTLNMRTVIWRAGLEAFSKSPVGGIGSGAYPETTVALLGRPWGEFTPVAHNAYLSVLVETGIIGFVLFLIVLSAVTANIWSLGGITRQFWCTLFAVWAVGVLSLTWEYRKPTWLLFALVASHAAAWARLAREKESITLPARLWSYEKRLV